MNDRKSRYVFRSQLVYIVRTPINRYRRPVTYGSDLRAAAAPSPAIRERRRASLNNTTAGEFFSVDAYKTPYRAILRADEKKKKIKRFIYRRRSFLRENIVFV